MEGQNIFRAVRFPLSHLPTWFLIIGYPLFWLELYFLRSGSANTTSLSWIIFVLIFAVLGFQNFPRLARGFRKLFSWFLEQSVLVKILLVFISIGSLAILFIAGYASLLPPHLIQEGDALNYHITLPRQHLLRGSFSHIPWSTADLFLLPVDFALSPFWLATSLPNKLPQFIFLIGLLAVSGRLAWRLSNHKIWPPSLLIIAIIGTHSIGIQAGTAMLDILICYLFIASVDSFLNRQFKLAAVELCFYIWSKPFMPVQFIVILIVFSLMCFILGIGKRIEFVLGKKVKEFVGEVWPVVLKTMGLFFILSLIVAGPFIVKSLRYSGTPLFPVGVGSFKSFSVSKSSQQWAELEQKTENLLATRTQYGSGWGFLEFIKHFWLVSVPEKGVNNRYDYPLGLMYLLFLGPFVFFLFSSLRRKVLPLLSLWIIVSWLIWWYGIQQTRFLFVPLILMYLVVVLLIGKPSSIMLGAMLISIFLVTASVYRAHVQDFGRWGEAVLRLKDKELIQLGKSNYPGVPDFHDLAYATFIVDKVNSNDPVFILRTFVNSDAALHKE
ncbi:MAG: hypothetical protein PHV17_04285 [Candidatus Omnitrophica bacterium]|nr:hypothetical protein [Candidatus Omnitrophota bacterium]